MFYRRRHTLWILASLLFLGGALAVAFLQINKAEHRADQIAAEADLRGSAVSTLATDVRKLRSQLQADGKTPVAPDPSRAVEDLPDRAEVPVPIPGPPGPPGVNGEDGQNGRPAPTITPSPGQPGTAGQDSTVPGPPGEQGPPGPAGADSTVPGPQGEQGPPGPAGADGTDGRDGQACPDGYSLQPPADDPDALVCRRDGAPAEPDPGPLALALDPRRQYP